MARMHQNTTMLRQHVSEDFNAPLDNILTMISLSKEFLGRMIQSASDKNIGGEEQRLEGVAVQAEDQWADESRPVSSNGADIGLEQSPSAPLETSSRSSSIPHVTCTAQESSVESYDSNEIIFPLESPKETLSPVNKARDHGAGKQNVTDPLQDKGRSSIKLVPIPISELV